MRLYLDTEWADPEGKQLVSLALVDSAGRSRYYREIAPLPLKSRMHNGAAKDAT